MEREFLKTAAPHSPIRSPGSDLESSYSQEIKNLAKEKLKNARN